MENHIPEKNLHTTNLGPLTFGFDIGIASVGWAVLSEERIVDLGVRAFNMAEINDKGKGKSLNFERRTARLARRRLRRRAWRLTRLARLMRRQGMITDAHYFKKQPSHADSVWQLRKEGLDRLLSHEEWARVIYHICKRRGFHWTSSAEEKAAEEDAASETGRVKQALQSTRALMKEKNYRTAAEMVLAEFPIAQRNKKDDYTKSLSRVLLADELHQLFIAQRGFGHAHAGEDLALQILGNGDKKSGLFWLQKPPLMGDGLLKMLGKCTFEPSEFRAPKASFTAERHVWLTRLNNTRITVDGMSRGLTEEEHRICVNLPYQSKEKFTYKNLRKALVAVGVSESFKFTGLAYPSAAQLAAGQAKSPEDEVMIKLSAWHELKTVFKKEGLEDIWQAMAQQALDGNPHLLDDIAWVLSVYKEDFEVNAELQKLGLPGGDATINALLKVRFDKFHALSLKALRNIVPHMMQGMRYDEACAAASYHHSQVKKVGHGTHRTLPPLYMGRDSRGSMQFNSDLNVPRNPVVIRAVNQARKVLNALVKTYGSPAKVHIELARDLARPLEEREAIRKEQESYKEKNLQVRAEFDEIACDLGLEGKPRGKDFEKYRLYDEQGGKCAYSLGVIERHRLLEVGYVEVDHALPYSRSFDDGKNNKVLVFTHENRNKGNRTPYEYLDGANHSERWLRFVAFVESNKAYRQAKRSRLLRKDFGKEEASSFRERNLNDTRYIARFFKNYVEEHLQLAQGSGQGRCVVLNGQLTAFLRARWGLVKVRDESDRHHALDAVVIAACSHSMVKRLADYSRRKELKQMREGFVDIETGEILNPATFAQLEAHFPTPWLNFRDELECRLKEDNVEALRNRLSMLGTYPEPVLSAVKPLFVSRAPQRRNGGAVHKATVYGKTANGITEKVHVRDLTLKDMDKLVEPHRNEKLYAAIRQWLEAREANEKQAKAIEASAGKGKDRRELTAAEKAEIALLRELPRKPRNDGAPGALVRSVKLEKEKMTGIPVRGGLAMNETMLRVDVFSKAGKFYLVPVYLHHRVTGLPNRAATAAKPESEWTVVDETFTFGFQLQRNDYVHIQQKGKPLIKGYYAGFDRASASLTLWAHDRNSTVGKDGLIRGIGVKTALSIEKFHVDVLGRIYAAKQEVRNGVAKRDGEPAC